MRYFIPFLFLLLACTEEEPEKQAPPPSPPKLEDTFTISLDRLRLRDQPGVNGKVITELPKGTLVKDLGEVSNFTTPIKLRGTQFDEPWWKVQLEDGTKGWIYGSPLVIASADEEFKKQFLATKRMQALCGKSLSQRIQAYQLAFSTVKTVRDFATLFREGIQIRDSLGLFIDQRLEQHQTEQLPDLFWLKEVLPGFVPQLVAEGTSYYLFADFKVFQALAVQTASPADDAFIQLELMAHPEDSIEYFFPVWLIQTWDYGGHSLLGRGHHQALFQQMETLLQQDSLFQEEVLQMKQQLLQDIAVAGSGYWENQEKIIAELDTILQQDFTIFTKTDVVMLQARRQQFEDPGANDIILNQKAGLN